MTDLEMIVAEGSAQKLAKLQIQVFITETRILTVKNVALHKELMEELEGLYIDRNILTKQLYDL